MGHPRDSRAGAGPPLSRLAVWSERVRRWLRPPRRLRPTRAGWLFFLITFAVGFAALNTGNNLLYLVLALMLAFLVLSGVLSESALRGIHVRRRLPREIFDGAVCAVGLEVSNVQQRVPAFAIVIEDHVAESGGSERPAGRVFALRIGPGETESRAYRFVARERGEILFVRFEVSTRFPFGLFSKALTLEAPQPALVYPAVEPVRALTSPGATREAGDSSDGARGLGSEVTGLREYEPGDPMRRIHWPTTLRHGDPMVRDVDREQRAEVEVQLRTRGQRAGERFEGSVRWAASEVVAFLEAGTRVALRTDATRIAAAEGQGQRARLLAFLARVEPEPRATPEAP